MKNKDKFVKIIDDINKMPINEKDNEKIMENLEKLENNYNEIKNEPYMRFYEVISYVEELELRDIAKEKIARKLQEIETDYYRLKKSTDMKIDVLEKEKEILLNNYIKKDNDVNYLYSILKNLNNSKFYRFFKKIKKVEDGF